MIERPIKISQSYIYRTCMKRSFTFRPGCFWFGVVSDLGRKWLPRPRAARRLGIHPARPRSPTSQEMVSSEWDNRSSVCAQPDTYVV